MCVLRACVRARARVNECVYVYIYIYIVTVCNVISLWSNTLLKVVFVQMYVNAVFVFVRCTAQGV